MSQKERMLSQMLYLPDGDETLTSERNACKDLCHEYNQLRPSNTSAQRELLDRLLGKLGGQSLILPPFWCDYGYNIQAGEGLFANHGLIILDPGKVTFGNNVLIGPNCGFYTAGHPLDYMQRREGYEFAYPITVGDDVWFGGGVQVMLGVTIGNNVVIGSGSVVTNDIPDNVVAAGNPCRVLRSITDEDRMPRDLDATLVDRG